MEKKDNYRIQANQAKERFLTFDQEALIHKFNLSYDADYLFVNFLCQPYRIDRRTGIPEKAEGGQWVNGDTYNEVMTLLDLLCDSRDHRRLSGQWKNMQSFGLMFHQNLLENQRNSWADRFQDAPEVFRRGCLALNGIPVPGADIGFAVEFFDGMRVAVQFWFGDDEFFPRLRYLWDENALQYIHYETMYFAIPLVLERINALGKGLPADVGID